MHFICYVLRKSSKWWILDMRVLLTLYSLNLMITSKYFGYSTRTLTCHHNRLWTIPLTIIITESSKKLTYALISKIHTVGFIYLPSTFHIAKNKCTNWADDWKRGLCFKIHTKCESILKPYLKNSKGCCL